MFMRLFVYAVITINQENNKPFTKPFSEIGNRRLEGKRQLRNFRNLAIQQFCSSTN